jgi:5-methylcytosine-specific restriction endonuclease McrA
MSRRRRLTAEERERVLRNLAERDGARCFYCAHPFTHLGSATLDHYIPHCLWRTWKQRNLVLACGPCNEAKADRLPWPVVVLLLRNVRQHELWRRACGLAA